MTGMGGRYKCKARGLWKRAVSSFPSTTSTCISRISSFLHLFEKVHVRPAPLIAALKVTQLAASTAGSTSWSQMPNPSSMYRLGCIRLQKTRLFGVPKDKTQTCHRDMSDMSARRVATTPVLASSITPLRHVWKTCETCLEKTYLLILTLILHPTTHPSIQPPTQSPSQPPNLTTNPPTNHPNTPPHPTTQPINQPINRPLNQSTNKPMNLLTHQPTQPSIQPST